MIQSKKLVLVLASAALLASCGGGASSDNSKDTAGKDTADSAGSVDIGASVYGGLIVDYTMPNLLGVSTFTDTYSGAYIYTPKVNEKVYLVPSFSGANELDYIDIDGTKYQAQVGAAGMKFNCYGGELNMEGVKYVSFNMTKTAPTIKAYSKAVTGGKTHKVTLNVANTTTEVKKFDMDNDEWVNAKTGTNIDAYFSTKGTHEVEILEGSLASWLIQGQDLENFHEGVYKYSAASEGLTLVNNTLEASINNTMKTTGSFVMPKNDVTVNVNFVDAYKTGKAFALVHGGSYVGAADVELVSSMNYTTHTNEITLLGANLHEVELPTSLTVSAEEKAKLAATDYVEATVMSYGSEVNKVYYKTVKFGGVTLTGAYDAAKKSFKYEGADFSKEEVCEAYYNAVMSNDVTIVLSTGNKVVGHAQLNKEENGYGGTKFDWAMNRDKTVGAFVQYGPEAMQASVRRDPKKDGDGQWVVKNSDDEDVKIGATWTDLNSKPASGYVSYVDLLVNAYNKVAK